jgi:energy-coupling factor transporter ATP-binding protein EcfA2
MHHDPIVCIDNLSYQYPRSPGLVLRDVNLSIRRGEFLGIVGATGAGKTTLCLALNGIVPQFHGGRFFGRVSIAGLDTIENPIHLLAQHVAMVFQDPETQLIANSVEDEVAFGLENVRLPRDEILQRIRWALETVRLDGMEAKHPSELSGGEKQRLAIAAALALQPEVLVLDEPTSQLDPLGKQQVFATVRELNTHLGITVILVSHASEEIAEFVDRVALLANGELVDVDLPSRIFSQADLSNQHAIRPPQVTSFYMELRDRGFDPPSTPVTLEEATQTYETMRTRIQVNPLTVPDKVAGEPAAPVLLSAQGVEHVYPDGTEALRGISLDVREGDYLVIVGQNGAGKTTLVKHFLHLLEPAAGQVLLNGHDVSDLEVSELAQRIGFVAQNPDNQIFNTTVEAEVAFALQNLGVGGSELAGRVEESLSTMGLADYRTWHPLSLPKGDRARVVIAAVLAMQPDVLIFDEPTTGQDYYGAKRILDVSRQLHQAGKTVIVITHHLYLMPGYAERVVLMGKGVILLDAPIRTAFHEAALLRSSYLAPPQIVQFAQHVASREGLSPLPVLTHEELATCITEREDSA